MENKTIHLHGFLRSDHYEGMRFSGEDESIAQIISGYIARENGYSKHQPEDDFQTVISLNVPNVFLRMHFSDKEISLAEAENNQILSSVGELDIYTEWYGYSEYSIEGYSVENFTVGNHNIEEILESNNNKYVHILID